ncbi:MAG TPA: exodeoxyribonuclease VII small subunit [Solirubrobacteraceae bacterium]|jgi:exodeoxyribonuclease VII small subunit
MNDTPAQQQTYETAAARVEEIIRRLDSGEASLGETLELVREGKTLIEFCAAELQTVSGALEELRLEDLVARLEGEAGRPRTDPAADGDTGRPHTDTPANGDSGRPPEEIR